MFWEKVNHRLIFESGTCLASGSAKYIYDNYQIVFTEYTTGSGCGPVKIRAVECPDHMLSFLRLKYR